MTYLTPDDARVGYKCPVARTFSEKIGHNCDGDACILWRWRSMMASDPVFMAAVKREETRLADEEGKGKSPHHFHKKAVSNVVSDLGAHGVKPTLGFCGLGGTPS